MRIVLLAKKGGVGKSTISLLLFDALRHVGRRCVLVDWDAQGTSSKALELMGLTEKPAQPEIYIYDTPPSLEHPATATAVRNADLCLVVTTPAPADVWEAEEAVRFVEARNPAAQVRTVFNKVKKATVLGKLVQDSAKLIPAGNLGANLSNRECYQHAVAQGWKALDGAAREEVLQLALATLAARPAVVKH